MHIFKVHPIERHSVMLLDGIHIMLRSLNGGFPLKTYGNDEKVYFVGCTLIMKKSYKRTYERTILY